MVCDHRVIVLAPRLRQGSGCFAQGLTAGSGQEDCKWGSGPAPHHLHGLLNLLPASGLR